MLSGLLKTLFGKAGRPSITAKGPRKKVGTPFIAFVTAVDEPHFLSEGETLASDQASMRLRVGIPAAQLARRFPVWLVPLDYVVQDPMLDQLGTARAVVLGKLPVRFFTQERPRATALLEWLETYSRQHHAVVDFSDDLAAAAVMYSQPSLAEFQTRLLEACPATVPTHALRERLLAYARHGISVVEDPYESAAAREPRLAVGPELRLAWFGVFAAEQRPFIESQLASIARANRSRPVDFAFVTHAAQAQVVQEMAQALKGISPLFALRHVPWSVAATADALARADVVVLPQNASSDWGRVKSHNRLVEAIRAGRFTVASPISAYVELSGYAWIGAELAAGIEWALANPADALHRVVQGQEYVSRRFAPEAIGARWAEALQLDRNLR